MNVVYGLITVICVIAAGVAVILAIVRPQYRGAFCFTALGVLLAIPVAHSFGSGERDTRPGTQTPVQKFTSDDAIPPSLDNKRTVTPETSVLSNTPQEEEARAARTLDSRREDPELESQSGASASDRSSVRDGASSPLASEGTVPQHLGSTSVSVNGDLDTAARNEVASAVMNALRLRGWAGLSGGGRKRLVITASASDAGLVLGEINAASVSLQWRLLSSSGEELASGGVGDVRGRGLDEADARRNAIQRAASQAADQIASG